MKKLVLFYLALLLSACSSEQKKEETKDSTASITPIESDETVTNNSEKIERPYLASPDSGTLQVVRRLENSFSSIPFFAILEDKYWYYAQSGKSSGQSIFNGSARYGLVDAMGEILLPIEYDKIYNPDATASACFEIEVSGKRGLFNYETSKILAPEFNVIFPSSHKDFIAIGIQDDRSMGIKKDFATQLISDFKGYEDPANRAFDLKAFPLIYNSSSLESPESGMGVIIPPSYLADLNFPEIIGDIITSDGAEFGTAIANGKVEESKSVTEKITAMITNFYESVSDARGYEHDQKKLVVVDSKNRVISTTNLQDVNGYRGSYCQDEGDYAFVGKNIVETRIRLNTSEVYDKYDEIPGYQYYSIDDNGKIEVLESNRLFDATKFSLLTEDHVKGCFSKSREYDEQGNVWVSDHLDLEDLDLMRNEIFAEYGLIFKTEKWNTYFRKQKWYKPQYNNVDKFLTETDKKNIDFILKLKEKIKDNEKETVNKRIEQYVAAG